VAIENSASDAVECHLIEAVKQRLGEVDALLEAFASAEEDGVYRYYHQSLKVYTLQGAVKRAQRLLEDLAPSGTELNAWLVAICEDACAHRFRLK
jgi:hypothetical protein